MNHSRVILARLFAAVALLVGACASAPKPPTAPAPPSAAEQVKDMQRGVNIVGYDPLWRDAARARFKPRYFELLRQAGFSSVRMVLPVAPFAKTAGDPLPDSWFATLDGLVREALAQGLTVILDDHDYRP